MLARQAGGSRRSLLTDTSAASFRVRIISSKRAKVNTVTARGRIQSNYRGAGGAQGPRPRPPLQAWGSRSRQQGPPLGVPLAGSFSRVGHSPHRARFPAPRPPRRFPVGRDPRGPSPVASRPLQKKGRASCVSRRLPAGRRSSAGVSAAVSLSAHGPRATISLPRHDRAAAPSQAPVWQSVLPLGTWDSCEGRGSLRQSWQARASAESTASSSGVFEGRLRDVGRRSWVG